ncbi:hypothetical protein Acr_21g0008090 [Actinidia rufa]|uniref:Uncharacterized protein n=1 Tax=Actinidia rufa TaxID=165716 RepID=A0A7J0GHB5_9ERIC|nr:hypothetical protein Acr_21g0008090 [Actinidia rufa]
MGSDNAEVTDDSATISDNDGVVVETDVDVKNAVDSDLPSDPSPFSQGEKVIASFNGNLYIAKVGKSRYGVGEERQGRREVFILSFTGMKGWDEWVGMDRLMKFTEEKEKEINKKQGTEKITKIGRVSQIKPKDSNVARGKKRKKHPGTKLTDLTLSVASPESSVTYLYERATLAPLSAMNESLYLLFCPTGVPWHTTSDRATLALPHIPSEQVTLPP